VCQLSIYNSFPVIRTTIAKKSSFLRTLTFIFCLPWGRPCGNHAKRCMNEKTIQCLPNHVPIYLKQFPSYSNHKCKKLPFSRTAAHIFVSPGDAPAIIMQYVAWMKRQFNACQNPHSMYPSILNSFPIIRTASAKNRSFHVPQPTLLLPLEMPLRSSRNMLHGWKDNSMLVKPLTACTHLSSIVSQLFELQVQKSPFSRTAAHIFVSPRTPCNYHPIFPMDGKTIQCLPNPLLHVPIYLQ